jgi:hypothetical protein
VSPPAPGFLAGVLLATIGVALELAVNKDLATAIGIAVLGVAAAIFGNADDAPGSCSRASC